MKNKIAKMITILSLIITLIFPYNLISYAEDKTNTNENLTPIRSNYYKIDEKNKTISIVEPETDISKFKERIIATTSNNENGEYKIYTNENKNQIVTTGIIKTGMVLHTSNADYPISVIGDIDGDGKITQIDLSLIIKYRVGLKGYELNKISKLSADISLDEKIDQVDITKIIKYLTYGELDLNRDNLRDLEKPQVTLIEKNKTTNSISVEAGATDNVAMPEVPIFVFYLKEENKNYEKKQEGKSSTYTATDLMANTQYTIKAEVKDEAGNTGSKEVTVTTDSMPNVKETHGVISFDEISWTNNKANVVISTNTDYVIQYQINGKDGQWITGEKGKTIASGMVHGDKLYARLTDGINVSDIKVTTVEDTEKPNVILTEKNKTTNSISVEAEAEDNAQMPDQPIYVFYLKDEQGNYKQKQSGPNIIYTETGLKSNTEYTIKVEVRDAVGNKGSNEITLSTTDLPNVSDDEENRPLDFKDLTWKNQKASIVIFTNTDYAIQYKINDVDETWTSVKNGEKEVIVDNLSNGDKVYARLTDGTNVTNITMITIIDKVSPEVTLTLKEKTTNSVSVEANATDNAGISETPTYIFYLKEENGEYVEKQNGISKIFTATGLKTNVKYTIKVTVEDLVGNVGTKEILVLANDMPQIKNDDENGMITFKDLKWENQKASITISTNTNYTLQYQTNNDSEEGWVSAEESGKDISIENLIHGDKVYARLTDGINVTNVKWIIIKDTIKPDVTLTEKNKTTNSISVEADATDNYALPEQPVYVFYLKEDDNDYKQMQSGLSASYVATDLKANTKYSIMVEVTDKSGNIGSTEISITTNEMPNIEENSLIKFKDLTWIDQKANITITTDTEYEIQYQVNNIADNWINATEKGTKSEVIVGNLIHGSIVYARLTDGKNPTNTTSITIKDIVNPTLTFSNVTTTTKSISVDIEATDNAGMPETPTYTFYLKEGTGDYKQKQNNANTTFNATGLKSSTEYTIKAETRDAVGNIGTKEITITTNDMPNVTTDKEAIKFNNFVWKDEKSSVEISTNTDYTIQYQVNDTDGEWINGSKVENLLHGDIVYARLVDDNMNLTNITSFVVMDNIKPTGNVTLAAKTAKPGKTINATVNATDNESGINLTDCKWILNNSETNLGTDETLYTGGNLTSDGSLNAKASNDEGTQYLHILLKDKAENTLEIISEKIVITTYNYTSVNMVEYDAGDWTQDEINSLSSLKLYNINTSRNANAESNLNFTFGGFTYKGDTTNTSDISSGTLTTSRNRSIAPKNGNGTPASDGWMVLEWGDTIGNKSYVKSLVHAGSPENFVYYYTSPNDSYKAEYILSGGTRQSTYNTYNQRDFSMYKDKNKLNMINGIHAMTYDESLKITGNTDNTKDSSRTIESYYWLASAGSNRNLWGVSNYGGIFSSVNHCWGIRPVVTLLSGVYVDKTKHSGTGTDKYVLEMD